MGRMTGLRAAASLAGSTCSALTPNRMLFKSLASNKACSLVPSRVAAYTGHKMNCQRSLQRTWLEKMCQNRVAANPSKGPWVLVNSIISGRDKRRCAG